MLDSPRDIPCSVCKAPVGAPCVFARHPDPAYHGRRLPGWHSERKYDDLQLARAAAEALLGE